jgi:hypothetical protein
MFGARLVPDSVNTIIVRDDRSPSKQAARRAPSNSAVASAAPKAPPPVTPSALAEGGFTPDDIKEILLQQAIYCGVPAANHAVKEASAIVQELGLLKG